VPKSRLNSLWEWDVMRLRYSDNNERLRTSGADTVGTQTKPGTDEVFSPAVYVEEVASDE